VLTFIPGLIVGFIASAIGVFFCLTILANLVDSTPSNGAPVAGCIAFAGAIGALIGAGWLLRSKPWQPKYLFIGFLIALCLVCLLEGSCFYANGTGIEGH